ncbi:MAG: Two-component system sensor histidine kinase, partial [uncultured Rubrobacteraceae bacterium]
AEDQQGAARQGGPLHHGGVQESGDFRDLQDQRSLKGPGQAGARQRHDARSARTDQKLIAGAARDVGRRRAGSGPVGASGPQRPPGHPVSGLDRGRRVAHHAPGARRVVLDHPRGDEKRRNALGSQYHNHRGRHIQGSREGGRRRRRSRIRTRRGSTPRRRYGARLHEGACFAPGRCRQPGVRIGRRHEGGGTSALAGKPAL